nr:polyprotein [Alphaendornavirus sp.]
MNGKLSSTRSTITPQLKNNASKCPNPPGVGAAVQPQWAGWPETNISKFLEKMVTHKFTDSKEQAAQLFCAIAQKFSSCGIKFSCSLEQYDHLTFVWHNNLNVEELNLIRDAKSALETVGKDNSSGSVKTIQTDKTRVSKVTTKENHVGDIYAWWRKKQMVDKDKKSTSDVDKVLKMRRLKNLIESFCTEEEATSMLKGLDPDPMALDSIEHWLHSKRPTSLEDFTRLFEQDPPRKEPTNNTLPGIKTAGVLGETNDEFVAKLVGRTATRGRPDWINAMAEGRTFRLSQLDSCTELICPPNIGKTKARNLAYDVTDAEHSSDTSTMVTLQGLIPAGNYHIRRGETKYLFFDSLCADEERQRTIKWSNAVGMHMPHIKLTHREQFFAIIDRARPSKLQHQDSETPQGSGQRIRTLDSDTLHASKNATVFQPDLFDQFMVEDLAMPYGSGKGCVRAMINDIDDRSHGLTGRGAIRSNGGTKISTTCWPRLEDHKDRAELAQGWAWREQGEKLDPHQSKVGLRLYSAFDLGILMARRESAMITIHMSGLRCGCAMLMIKGQEKCLWNQQTCHRCGGAIGTPIVGKDKRGESELQGEVSMDIMATWTMKGKEFTLNKINEQKWFAYNREAIPWDMAKCFNRLPRRYAKQFTPAKHGIPIIFVPDNGGKTLLTKSNPRMISMWHTYTAFGIKDSQTFAMARPVLTLNAMLPNHIICSAVGDFIDTDYCTIQYTTGYIHKPLRTFHAVDVASQLAHLQKQGLHGKFYTNLPAMLHDASLATNSHVPAMWKFHKCTCGGAVNLPTAHLFKVGQNCVCMGETAMVPGGEFDSGRIQDKWIYEGPTPIDMCYKQVAKNYSHPKHPQFVGGGVNDWSRHCENGLLYLAQPAKELNWINHHIMHYTRTQLNFQPKIDVAKIPREWVTHQGSLRRGENALRNSDIVEENVHRMHPSIKLVKIKYKEIMWCDRISECLDEAKLANGDIYVSASYDIEWKQNAQLIELSLGEENKWSVDTISENHTIIRVPGCNFGRELACWRVVVAMLIKIKHQQARVVIINGRNDSAENNYLKLEETYATNLGKARQHQGWITLNPWDMNIFGLWWCELNFTPTIEEAQTCASTTMAYGFVYGTDEMMGITLGRDLITVRCDMRQVDGIEQQWRVGPSTWRHEPSVKLAMEKGSKEVIIN